MCNTCFDGIHANRSKNLYTVKRFILNLFQLCNNWQRIKFDNTFLSAKRRKHSLIQKLLSKNVQTLPSQTTKTFSRTAFVIMTRTPLVAIELLHGLYSAECCSVENRGSKICNETLSCMWSFIEIS